MALAAKWLCWLCCVVVLYDARCCTMHHELLGCGLICACCDVANS
jgi:hypothetical protein